MPIISLCQRSFFMEILVAQFYMHTLFVFLAEASKVLFANNAFSYGT